MTEYPLAANTIGAEEIAAAKLVLDSGNLTMGLRVREMESCFANWLGVSHAIMVNSGSSANLLMIENLVRRSRVEAPLQAGDKVIVPALAWPTTVWPILQLGLVPVFVDINPQSLAIDLESARSVLDDRVKAMFLIGVLGQPPCMEDYVAFCKEHGLILLEDNCESLGAKSGGKYLGSFGLMSSFSFYFSHHITSIEGGMVVTNDDLLADDIRSTRSHGWTRDRRDRDYWSQAHPEIDDRFLFISQGYNLRPTEIQAAIGMVQLKNFDDSQASRQELAQKVLSWIGEDLPWLQLVGKSFLESPSSDSAIHTWMTFPFLLDPKCRPQAVKTVCRFLEERGVECRPIIAGNLTRHPSFDPRKCQVADSLEVCDSVYYGGFMIGCHPFAPKASQETLRKALMDLKGITNEII